MGWPTVSQVIDFYMHHLIVSRRYPWKSGKVIGCIVGGAVLVVIFCFYGEHLLGRIAYQS